MLFQNYVPHKFPLSQRKETNFGHMMIDISLLPIYHLHSRAFPERSIKRNSFTCILTYGNDQGCQINLKVQTEAIVNITMLYCFWKRKKKIHWHLQIGLELTSRLTRLLLAINNLGIPAPDKVAPRLIKWNKTRPLYSLKHRQIQGPCAVYLYHTSLSWLRWVTVTSLSMTDLLLL